jgi:hypothetical protein
MAVQLVGFDGTGNAIPEVHALKASAGQAHRGAARFVAAFSYSWLEYFAVRLQAFFRVSISQVFRGDSFSNLKPSRSP